MERAHCRKTESLERIHPVDGRTLLSPVGDRGEPAWRTLDLLKKHPDLHVEMTKVVSTAFVSLLAAEGSMGRGRRRGVETSCTV